MELQKEEIEMNYLDIMSIIRTNKSREEGDIEDKKKNIHRNYTLAKLDFVVIENKQDVVETYDRILKELDGLHDRIVKRNRG